MLEPVGDVCVPTVTDLARFPVPWRLKAAAWTCLRVDIIREMFDTNTVLKIMLSPFPL